MPLFVAALRLSMLFLNVYDSFKTLKPPPGSSRNGGQPSVRALSQRKRNMKGCLAVWIVWCCFAAYERLLESVICLFIPFYHEFKSIALLFLILTRARGAEPIYLHIIRPLLKPYTSTLDSIIELATMFGDFIFLVGLLPYRLAESWWRTHVHEDGTLDSDAEIHISRPRADRMHTYAQDSLRVSHDMNGPLSHGRPFPASERRSVSAEEMQRRIEQTTRRSSAGSAHSAQTHLPVALDEGTNRNSNAIRLDLPQSQTGQSVSSRLQYEIWYPPSSSYGDSTENGLKSAGKEDGTTVSVLQADEPESEETIRELQQLEEWRQYPPFPSAYPPTPLVPKPRRLPNVQGAGTLNAQYPGIPEEPQLQDFERSLLPAREPLNPSSVGCLSDRSSQSGVQNIVSDEEQSSSMIVDEDVDGASEMTDDEDEDEFNVTLRTPLPTSNTLRPQFRSGSRRLESIASSSASIPSRSTALTTNDNGSSLRTRTSSESSSSESASITGDSSSLGQKRPLPRSFVGDDQLTNLPPKKPLSKIHSPKRVFRTRPRPVMTSYSSRKPRRQTPKPSSPSTSLPSGHQRENSPVVSGDDDSSVHDPQLPQQKRRRVIASTRETSSRTTRASARKTTLAPATKSRAEKSRGPPSLTSRASSRSNIALAPLAGAKGDLPPHGSTSSVDKRTKSRNSAK